MGVLCECLGRKKKEGDEDEYMSHKVSYWWFRRTQYITSIGMFYNIGDFTWRVPVCEELVGCYSQEKRGSVVVQESRIKPDPPYSP